MDGWYISLLVAERCADIRRDVASFHQAQQAQPGIKWFSQRMLSLGLWLVAIGESLCQRYEMNERKTVLKGF